jgi:predicted DNA-binding protein
MASKGKRIPEAPLSLRLPPEDVERLDKLVETTNGLTSRHALAKVALRIGLDEIEKDRTLMLGLKRK